MTADPIVSATARPKGERRRTSLPFLAFILIVLAALIVGPFWLLRPRAETFLVRTYQTAAVQRGTVVEYVRSAGTLVPQQQRSLAAPGAGVLTQWLVSEGDEVQAGDPLGHLASPELERNVGARQAELAAAETRRAELALQHSLAEHQDANAIARIELELADARIVGRAQTVRLLEQDLAFQTNYNAEAAAVRRMALASADAGIAQARAALESAMAQAAALELHAPISGRIISLNADQGAPVSANQNLLTLASTTDLRVTTEVNETQARRIATGQPANLRIAGVDHTGSVVTVGQQAESTGSAQGATVAVTLAFDEPATDLRLGGSVAVEIEVGRKEDALQLPRGAYLTTGGERLAYVVQGSEAVRVPVTFGLIDGNLVEVLDGLTEGQRVVTSSYETFREHATVQLAPEGEIR